MEDRNILDPKEYRKIINSVELQSIFLDSCSVKTHRENLNDNMKLHITHKSSFQINDNSSIISSDYEILASKEKKRDFAFKINCTFNVVITSENISEAFLNTYCKYNLNVNTWPFCREFVQSMVNRIGFPPLTLPLLKPPKS